DDAITLVPYTEPANGLSGLVPDWEQVDVGLFASLDGDILIIQALPAPAEVLLPILAEEFGVDVAPGPQATRTINTITWQIYTDTSGTEVIHFAVGQSEGGIAIFVVLQGPNAADLRETVFAPVIDALIVGEGSGAPPPGVSPETTSVPPTGADGPPIDPPPTPGQQVLLAPFVDPTAGFAALVPVGWTPSMPGVVMSADGDTLTLRVIDLPADAALMQITAAFGLGDTPTPVGERVINSRRWGLYVGAVDGQTAHVALGALEPARTGLVALSGPNADDLYTSVFLPVVDIFQLEVSTPPGFTGTPGSGTPPPVTQAVTFPEPPGQLIAVNGHRLHIDCIGEGAPTVILDAEWSSWSLELRPLQQQIAAITRVCVYDRAGYGWSDPGPEPRTAQQLVDELFALLNNSGESGPFIIAGHSFGGLTARLFASQHPDLVAGVVLIDALPPEFALRDDEFIPILPAPFIAELETLRDVLSEALVPPAVALDVVPDSALPPGLPADLADTYKIQFLRLQHIEAVLAEATALETSVRQVNGTTLGDLPLIVLIAGQDRPEGWRDTAEALAELSTDGALIVVAESGPRVPVDAPAAIVDAIQQLITP
ncbi:MAG: alpha/beta hydrolase, partial [Chloroflexi bacterium]|nr:alpha/beta hydrolase [Chloroflexota bacterium]